MEEMVLRFPVIAQQIFEELDNQDLIKFREVDMTFCSSIDQNRLIWTRMIKKYIKDNNKFRKIGDGESTNQNFRGPSIDN